MEGVSDEVIPHLAELLEPFLSQQTANMLDLGQILGFVAQTVHSSTFQVGGYTTLGRWSVLNLGKQLILPEVNAVIIRVLSDF